MKKHFMIIISIILVIICLSGCTDSMNANLNLLNNDTTLTISDFNGELKLYVGGNNNDITIDKNVRLKSIIIEGMDNTVRISHSINHVNVSINVYQGTNSEVVYYD